MGFFQAGNRYYLVNWKDSWKPESALIYCDKIIQQFWQETQKHTLPTSEEHTSSSLNNESMVDEDSSLYLPHRDDGTSQSSQSEDEVNITWYNNESKGTPKEILNVLEQQVVTSSEDIFTIGASNTMENNTIGVQEAEDCEDSIVLSPLNSNKTALNVSSIKLSRPYFFKSL